MRYPFQMYGRTVQIYHFQAVYTEYQLDNDGELVEVEITAQFPTEKEAKRTGGSVTTLDTTAYEWLDGIEVDDVPDTYAEAVKLYEMGQAAYETMLNTPSAEDDLLAMTVDHEYRLTLLELGLTE